MAESSIEPSEVPFKEKQKLFDISFEASLPTITGGSSVHGSSTNRPRSMSSAHNFDTTFEFPGRKAVIQDLPASFKRPRLYTEIQLTGNTSSNQGVQFESGHSQLQTQTSDFTQHGTTSENSLFSQTRSDSRTDPVSSEGEGVVDSSHSHHSRDQVKIYIMYSTVQQLMHGLILNM